MPANAMVKFQMVRRPRPRHFRAATIVIADSIVKERFKTGGCIARTRRETLEGSVALGSVLVRIASVRCWRDRLSSRRERKQGERKENDAEPAPQTQVAN
jgi:hypothetical protein